MQWSSSPIRPLVAVAVGIVLLGACGSDDAATVDSLPDTTPAESAPPADSLPAPDSVPAADTTTTAFPASDAGACLVGDWKIAGGDLQSLYDAVADEWGWPSIETSGEMLVSFTDTTYRIASDFTMVLEATDQPPFDAVGSGGSDGTWRAQDGVLFTTKLDGDLVLDITQDGAPLEEGSDAGIGLLQTTPLENAPFSCEGPTLMWPVDWPIEGPPKNRHPVTLAPA